MKLSYTERTRFGSGRSQELSLGYVKSEMPMRHPVGDVK